MRKLDITRDAFKFINELDAKQFRQVVRKLLALLAEPVPADSSKLTGYDYRRVDIGEYRIIYHFDDDTTYVVLIGKRNDDQVIKELGRK
jgi:mRNA interferase RelE/StbE